MEEASDVQKIITLADKYDLPGLVDLLCREMESKKLDGVMIAELLITAHQHGSENLRRIALDKIRADREIFSEEGFRSLMKKADPTIMMDLLKEF